MLGYLVALKYQIEVIWWRAMGLFGGAVGVIWWRVCSENRCDTMVFELLL